MIKQQLMISIHCLVYTLLFNVASAQADCYARYYNRGNDYLKKNAFDQAISQFQAAQQCKNLNPAQKKNLQTLITDAKRKKALRSVILKRV